MIGEPVELVAKVLLCCVCRNAQREVPPDVTEWICPPCVGKTVIAMAKYLNKPWWRRWLWTR